MSKISIAIDGPSGAGKSTVARRAAGDLGYIYVDTGALYRSIGLNALQNNIDTKDAGGVCSLLPETKVELKFVCGEQRVFLNGTDVSEAIRKNEVSMAASDVSAIPAVRDFLFDLQRRLAEENNVIMDGRDIGTVVLPNAQVKIFLTASAEKRAERRYNQLLEKGERVDISLLLEEIKQRDYNDSHRKIAPLKQADDAVLVDTSDIDLEQSIEAVKTVIRQKLK